MNNVSRNCTYKFHDVYEPEIACPACQCPTYQKVTAVIIPFPAKKRISPLMVACRVFEAAAYVFAFVTFYFWGYCHE